MTAKSRSKKLSSKSKIILKKRSFVITVVYFTVRGEFCHKFVFSRVFRTLGTIGKKCNMQDVVAYIRGLRDSGGQGSLPGMYTDGWTGYILVDCAQGSPHLILPG